MTVTYWFNNELPITTNVKELHVYFDQNTLQLVIEDHQLVNVWRELEALGFPNDSLTLTISKVDNP